MAIDAPISFGSFKGGQLFAIMTLAPVPSFAFRFQCYIMLPGATEQSQLAAQIRVSPVLLEFSASLAPRVSGLIDNRDNPAWPNAFGIKGLNIGELGLLAALNIQTGLPVEMGFTASLYLSNKKQTNNYTVALSGVFGVEPGNELIRIEQRNVDQCFFFVLAETILGDAFSQLESVESICAAFSWLKFDYSLLYFSTGAQIAAISYPPGGQLQADISLFGKYPVASVTGFIDVAGLNVAINGTINGFDLGPIKVSGLRGPDVTVSQTHCTHTSKQQVRVSIDWRLRCFVVLFCHCA